MSDKPTRRELARALGVVDDYVRRLARDGMPVDSISAALAWRQARYGRVERPAGDLSDPG